MNEGARRVEERRAHQELLALAVGGGGGDGREEPLERRAAEVEDPEVLRAEGGEVEVVAMEVVVEVVEVEVEVVEVK